jgi:phosphonate transport system ATP-binding protein
LVRINKHFGITVICNLHSLDLVRSYCNRVIGLASGRLVFDATPDMLSQAVARELFGVEDGDEVLAAPPAMPMPISAFARAAGL